jgi:hypothetical protein
MNVFLLLCFQSSAARPQGGAAKTVQVGTCGMIAGIGINSHFAGFERVSTRMNGGDSEMTNVQIWQKPRWAWVYRHSEKRNNAESA